MWVGVDTHYGYYGKLDLGFGRIERLVQRFRSLDTYRFVSPFIVALRKESREGVNLGETIGFAITTCVLFFVFQRGESCALCNVGRRPAVASPS